MTLRHNKLDREATIAKLKELKSRRKTAEHFAIGRSTLDRYLDAWGCELSFTGAHMKQNRSVVPRFEIGQTVTWVPVTARQRCFGLPIATMPIQVRIMGLRTGSGHYEVEVVNREHRAQLNRSSHVVHENALKETNEKQSQQTGLVK